MKDAVIVSAVRTPVGKAPRGTLSTTRPDELAAIVVREVLARAPAAHLLTHTAGFDQRVIGGFVASADQLTSLSDYVTRELPPCIRPPGQEMSYCNHCYSLAGLVVQEIANMPFEQYREDYLFRPLEMQRSSCRQPLPPELETKRALGYILAPEVQPAPSVYGNQFPSGGLWSSGEDMGRFIIGQLQGGLSGRGQILQKESLAEMHQRQFSQHPLLEGWTYGFFEHRENGERMIGKGGDVPGFSSDLNSLDI